jgi:predicted transcriptional regulator
MSIIFETNRFKHYGLLSFLKQMNCSVIQFKLLRFLLAHPQAHLCPDTIAGALDITRTFLSREIQPLVELGIVTEQSYNGITTYCLTTDPVIRNYISELANLDACETANIRKELFEEASSSANDLN